MSLLFTLFVYGSDQIESVYQGQSGPLVKISKVLPQAACASGQSLGLWSNSEGCNQEQSGLWSNSEGCNQEQPGHLVKIRRVLGGAA